MATSKESALYSRVLAEKEEAKKRLKLGQTRNQASRGRPADLNLEEPPNLSLSAALAASASQGSISQSRRAEGGMKMSASTAAGGLSQTDRLKGAIQSLRDEISSARHELSLKEKDATRFESEAAFMLYEDDIGEQRELGVRQMQQKKTELSGLEQKHLETLAYNNVLVFMEKRLLLQKVTFHGTLGGYEETLKLMQAEAKLVRQQLAEARRCKLSEEQLLAKFQDAARRRKVTLQEQLEKLRVEANQRESLLEMSDMSRKVDALDMSAESLEGEDASNFGKPWVGPAGTSSDEAALLYQTLKRDLAAVKAAASVNCASSDSSELFARRNDVEEERARLDGQLSELGSHVDHLSEFRTRLKSRAEPRGSDRASSATDVRGSKVDQNQRLDFAKRQLSLAKDEFEQLRATKVQLEQSIEALSSRLAKFVSLPNETAVSPDFASELVTQISKVTQKLVFLSNAVKEEVSGVASSTRQAPRQVAVRSESPKFARPSRSSSLQLDKSSDVASRKELLLSSAHSVVPRSEFNIRIRPAGSASGINKLSAKQLSAAADTFVAVQARLSASTSSLSVGRLSPLKRAGAGPATTGTIDAAVSHLEEEPSYTDSISDTASRILADAGINLEMQDSESDTEKWRGSSGDAAADRRRRLSRDPTQTLDDSADNSKGGARKNKRQTQLLRYATAAAIMGGDEPDDSIVPTRDSELVPTRDMVKHKARIVVQRQKQKKAVKTEE